MLLYAVAEFVLPDTSRPCTGEIFESINHCKRRFRGYARRRRARQRGLRALRTRVHTSFRMAVSEIAPSRICVPNMRPCYIPQNGTLRFCLFGCKLQSMMDDLDLYERPSVTNLTRYGT